MPPAVASTSRAMFLTLAIVTALLAVATLLPLWRNPHYLVRGWDFPRLQLMVLAGLLLAAQILLLRHDTPKFWGLLVVTLACITFQAWWIVPYTRMFPNEVKAARKSSPDDRLRLLASNVLQTNRESSKLIELVREHEPDLLIVLEVDEWWDEQLTALDEDYPHQVRHPQDNLYGMSLYSRLPLSRTETLNLVEEGIPSIHGLVELPGGTPIRFHFLHPAPPSPSENEESSQRDAELVIVARTVAEAQMPVIVAGDLNDVAWSRTTRLFRKLSGMLDPRVGRGMYNSYHAEYPIARWPLDHIFHTEHFTLGELARLPSIDSDHFPIFTELVFAPGEGFDQEGISASAEDYDLAASIRSEQGIDVQSVPQPGD